MNMPTCDYHDCDESICAYDLEEFPPWMERFCQTHSNIGQALAASGDVTGMLAFAAEVDPSKGKDGDAIEN